MELKQPRRRRRQLQLIKKKNNSFYEQNNGPASASLALFSTFLWLLDYDVKPPNAAFYGGPEHMTTNFPFSF